MFERPSFQKHQRDFKHALNRDRLGKEHVSLDDFVLAVGGGRESVVGKKEYTLIVVTSEPRRILLGKKHRGFGHGMFNSFGGKVESGESIDAGASRELYEETGIQVQKHVANAVSFMNYCRAGTLRFTFADSTNEMVVHLYRVRVSFSDDGRQETHACGETLILPSQSIIHGCEEITPIWFDDWNDIPLNEMFADDSIWLPTLLSESYSYINGRFHFAAGGQVTNTITDFILDLTPNL